jgi:hypothetical protein
VSRKPTLWLCVLSCVGLAVGCGPAPEAPGPARGTGTAFDDEPDPATSPLEGVTLCATDGPCETPDGRARGVIRAGRPEGIWTLLGPKGVRVAEGPMRAGVPDGPWRRWSPDGALLEEGRWAAGKPDGVWTMYRPDGSRFEEVSFADGLRHGPWLMLHRNGTVAERMEWARGQQVGVQIDYADDGTVLARGSFDAHRPVGTWTCFGPGGERSIPAPSSRETPAEACGLLQDDPPPGDPPPTPDPN